MNRRHCHRLFLIGIAALAISNANAATPPSQVAPTTFATALTGICPGAHTIDNGVRQADLDGDGIADASALVECPTGPNRRLVVFRGSADGTLRLLAQSAAWPVDPHRWDGLEVRKNVLIYQQGCAASCSQPTSLEYKFRYTQGTFVLIGQELRRMLRDEEHGKEIGVDTGMSVNYLAGKVMYFGKRGAARLQRTLDFETLPPVSLSGFDADKVDEQHRQIHALSGYVDATLALQFLN